METFIDEVESKGHKTFLKVKDEIDVVIADEMVIMMTREEIEKDGAKIMTPEEFLETYLNK